MSGHARAIMDMVKEQDANKRLDNWIALSRISRAVEYARKKLAPGIYELVAATGIRVYNGTRLSLKPGSVQYKFDHIAEWRRLRKLLDAVEARAIENFNNGGGSPGEPQYQAESVPSRATVIVHSSARSRPVKRGSEDEGGREEG